MKSANKLFPDIDASAGQFNQASHKIVCGPFQEEALGFPFPRQMKNHCATYNFLNAVPRDFESERV